MLSFGQIGRARLRVQFLQHARSYRLLGFQLRDSAVRIVDIAEDDRLGRTGLLAGGHDLAVAYRPVLLLRLDPCAALIRCTQYVHFSITPRLRTVTSGLRISFRLGVLSVVNTAGS